MAEPAKKPRPKLPQALQEEIRTLFAQELDDAGLRTRLEELAREPAFAGLTYFWGPELYGRNRVLFRPFILAHFSNWLFDGKRFKPVSWAKEIGTALEAWLARVEQADDVELFRRLYPWKNGTGSWGQLDPKKWQKDLLGAYRTAATAHERNHVLAKFDLWAALEEGAAVELYQRDPVAARPFILKHLPWKSTFWNEQARGLCQALCDLAHSRGDDEFYFTLYRKQIPLRDWEKDALELSSRIQDSRELVSALEKRHPEGWYLNLGSGLYNLVRLRGRDVFPYLLHHLGDIQRGWWRGDYGKLLDLARAREWWDLWSGLLRTCARPEEYDKEVARLAADRNLPEREVENRLLLLAGVSREWNFGPWGIAQVHQISDPTALTLYERFPTLLRGPFRMHLSTGWFGSYPRLIARALEQDDETLLDYLASRTVTRDTRHAKDLNQQAEVLADYYWKRLQEPRAFAQRAAIVLGQVPAYSIGNWYNHVIRHNRLARLFFERSSSALLEAPSALRDLLEAPEIHVQALALKALGLDDDQAREQSSVNLDLLQAMLLRPLHRQTRFLAFRALAHAAQTLDQARTILQRAREAWDLPDRKYPKEQLVGLIGQMLQRWPELRSAAEQPRIYQEASP